MKETQKVKMLKEFLEKKLISKYKDLDDLDLQFYIKNFLQDYIQKSIKNIKINFFVGNIDMLLSIIDYDCFEFNLICELSKFGYFISSLEIQKRRLIMQISEELILFCEIEI